MTRPRLLLLHGPGIGPRAFAPQLEASLPADIEIGEWIDHPPGMPLVDYAYHMASTLTPGTPDRPLVIAGLSFGGMVALEMARPLHAAKVLLISSARTGHAVSPLIWPLQRIVPHLPEWLYRIARVLMPPLLHMVYRRGEAGGSDRVVEVLRHDLDFPTWREGIGSIRNWQVSATPPMSILVNKNTKVICQGITGSAGAFHTKGASTTARRWSAASPPARAGRRTPTACRSSTPSRGRRATGADATMIFVPPPFAADAIMEAADAGIRVIVAITEGIPVLDMVKAKAFLKDYPRAC
jgi:pimeloyl-ACP methyl ester carboxylesterase